MKKRLFLIVIILLTSAAIAVLFLKCGRINVHENAVKQSAGGGVLKSVLKRAPVAHNKLTGYIFLPQKASETGRQTYGVWAAKIGPDGKKKWERTYSEKYDEWADLIVPARDGGFVIAAKEYTFGEDYDGVFLMKIDADGNSLWTKKFGRADEEEFSEPVQNGNLIAGRTFGDDNKSYGVFVAKTDMNGDYVSMTTFGSDYLSWGYTAVSTKDGHFVTAGIPDEYIPGGASGIFLIQRNKKGEYSWRKNFGGDKYDRGYSVAAAKDGGYLISGFTFSGGSGEEDFYVIKTDADGNSVWSRTYGGALSDRAYDGEQDMDGGFVIAGTTDSFRSDGDGYDAYVVKIDAAGNSLWARTYGGRGVYSAHSIACTKDGGYIIAGAANPGLKSGF